METNYNIETLFICLFIITVFTLWYKYVYLVKQRTKMKYVYEKLYRHIKQKKVITSLCIEMRNVLTTEEIKIVYKHFKSQKPSKKINKEFFNNKCFVGGVFWWKHYTLNEKLIDESTKQRKLFIFKMIKITTEN